MKHKKDIRTIDFHKILGESNCRSNKIWVDEGSKFYNRSMKLWLQDNDIEMYSTLENRKYVVAEKLKYKVSKYMTLSIKKSVYSKIRWYSHWIQKCKS